MLCSSSRGAETRLFQVFNGSEGVAAWECLGRHPLHKLYPTNQKGLVQISPVFNPSQPLLIPNSSGINTLSQLSSPHLDTEWCLQAKTHHKVSP